MKTEIEIQNKTKQRQIRQMKRQGSPQFSMLKGAPKVNNYYVDDGETHSVAFNKLIHQQIPPTICSLFLNKQCVRVIS